VHSILRGLDGVGRGSARRSTVAGARVAAGTPCTGQTSVVSVSGEVERARRSTVEVPGGFIGAGTGNDVDWALAQRGAREVGRGRALARRTRRTRGGVHLPVFKSLLRSQTCESWQKSDADLFLAPMAISCM
jgi:hypothetical protein